MPAGGGRIFAEVSSVFSSFEDEPLGVRLARNTGRSEYRSSGRELRREDERYLRMTAEEYDASFARRILKFDRAGMQYLHALEMAKRIWSVRNFDGELPAARGFEEFRNKLAKSGVRLLVINSPENPISLAWYGDSVWYRSYLEFLKNGPGRLYSFSSEERSLRRQLFYDYHHLSFYGAREFTARLSRTVASIMREEKPEGVQ